MVSKYKNKKQILEEKINWWKSVKQHFADMFIKEVLHLSSGLLEDVSHSVYLVLMILLKMHLLLQINIM